MRIRMKKAPRNHTHAHTFMQNVCARVPLDALRRSVSKKRIPPFRRGSDAVCGIKKTAARSFRAAVFFRKSLSHVFLMVFSCVKNLC